MYIKSSQLENINGKDYLRIFLEKEYPYKIKYDDRDIELLDFVIEEPNMKEIGVLKKLSISLEKMFTYSQVIKSMQIMSYITRDRVDEINSFRDDEEIDEEPSAITEDDKIAKTRFFIADVLKKSNDLENNETDYYLELDKFINFVSSKLYREHGDGIVLKAELSLLDQYKGESMVIKEEIIIEYISFFFKYFPSRSLIAHLKV